MRILRAADRTATPWKNGGGLTREVAVWPPGAGFDDFRWRISLAEMDMDAPFSVFAGVDRILAVLQGQLRLSFADGATVTLWPRSAPFPFAGESPVTGCVVAGPVLDFNVMTRRGAVGSTVKRLRIAGGLTLPGSRFPRLVLTRRPLKVCKPRRAILAPDDALLLKPRSPAVTLMGARGTILVATFPENKFHPARSALTVDGRDEIDPISTRRETRSPLSQI